MSGLTARLLIIWLRHDMCGLDLLRTIGLAGRFSRLARKGHLARPYQKGACVRLVFFRAPNAKLCLLGNNSHILGRGRYQYCMLSHPACMG
jgi:hypothetical protein